MLLPNFKKGDVMGAKVIVLLVIALSSYATASDESLNVSNELKYSVAYCISKSYPDSNIESDSRYISGAYIQKGDFGIDMYEVLREFVDSYRKNKYQSKHGRNLDIMQCLDLYESIELANIIKSHANKSIQPTAKASAD